MLTKSFFWWKTFSSDFIHLLIEGIDDPVLSLSGKMYVFIKTNVVVFFLIMIWCYSRRALVVLVVLVAQILGCTPSLYFRFST